MEHAFYFLGCIFLLIGCVWLGLKILDWIKQWRIDRYQTNTAHFLSDLYKLQNKWASAGEFGFAETCGNAIKFHGNVIQEAKKPGDIGITLTNDSLSNELQLKNNRKAELNEILTEFIG